MVDFGSAITAALIARLDRQLKRGSGHKGFCRAKGCPAPPYQKQWLYDVVAGVPACRRCVQGVIATLTAKLAATKAAAARRELRITGRMRRRLA